MAPLSRETFGLSWRLTAVVVGCLVALALPHVVVSVLVNGAEPDRVGIVGASAPSAPSPRGGATTSAGPTASGDATGAAGATGAKSPTALLDEATESCRLARLRLTAALAAANVSLAQFDKHIDAMNLLVAGKISLAVATQFWEETRVGATQNSSAFRRAQHELTANGASCSALPSAAAEGLPYGPVDRLSRCVRYVGAATTAVLRADPAVDTWVHHIHDMELLRAGEITPAQATAAWKRDWRTGEKQLKAFEAAHQQATSLRCTLA